jgi:hypothetical protein
MICSHCLWRKSKTCVELPFVTFAKVSDTFKVGRSCESKIWNTYPISGNVSRKQGGCGPQPVLFQDDLTFIEVLKREKPTMSIGEVTHQLNHYSIFPGYSGVSKWAVGRAIRAKMSDGAWSCKKVQPATDRFNPANLRYTQACIDYIVRNEPRKFKFFDESGFNVSL